MNGLLRQGPAAFYASTEAYNSSEHQIEEKYASSGQSQAQAPHQHALPKG